MKAVLETLLSLALPVVVFTLGVVKLVHYRRIGQRVRRGESWDRLETRKPFARILMPLTGLTFTFGGGTMIVVVIVATISGA